MKAEVASALGLPVEAFDEVVLAGPAGGLPARLPVEELCETAVTAGLVAARQLLRSRGGTPLEQLSMDRRHLAVSMTSERYLHLEGQEPTSPMDPLSRFLRTADGWVRLHGNYPAHRAAARGVLGDPEDAAAAERAASTWKSLDLEDAVVAAGGCAAALRTEAEWAVHPQGAAVAAEPLVARTPGRESGRRLGPAAQWEWARGARVLDLTRVIAGPVGTRQMAAAGADVIRVDPPDLPELPFQWRDFTPGKRSLLLDLSAGGDREVFDRLLAGADVVVVGYRTGGMARLGLDPDTLLDSHPGLVVVALDAWGWTGPWSGRRGFDSLVQVATGIGAVEGDGDSPGVLPAQALDQATGHLVAAAAMGALAERERTGVGGAARLSLARTARLLLEGTRAPDAVGQLPDSTPWMTSLEAPGPTGSPARLSLVAAPWGEWRSDPPVPGSATPEWLTA